MTTLLIICVVIGSVLLSFTTLVQMLYMDMSRLRAKELPSLEFFRAALADRIGLKAEQGTLSFSLIKHALLAMTGVVMLAISAGTGTISLARLAEALVFSGVLMLIAAYIVPQTLYRHTRGEWMQPLLPLVKVLALLVRPLTSFLGFLQSLAQLRDAQEQRGEEQSTPEENIAALITAGAEEGIIEENDRRLIQSVVAFGDKTVREVMTPRPSMVTIATGATLEDLRQLVIHEQFSRMPVYEDTIDQIVGFVHVRDMFELDHTERSQRKVGEVIRQIRFVPETKPVNDMLREMQGDGNHMAIVVDEYGNTAGLVTMEDMVEEIVGEIRDEHEPTSDIQRDEDGFIVSGSFDVDHLHDLVEFRATDETESTTVGGLVTEWMGRVPLPGESVEKEGIRMEVLASNELRVDQVRVSKVEPAPNV